METFFLRFNLPSTRTGKRPFWALKTMLSKAVPRVEIFENAGFSFTCGRTKTEIFESENTGTSITDAL